MAKYEQRMYSIALRHLSGIQKGIQSAHAIVEYSSKHNTKEYKQWAEEDKTLIILEAGTTAQLEKILKRLRKEGVKHSFFKEPDINDTITAVCILADERVFNTQRYPDADGKHLFLRELLKKLPLASN